MANHTFKDYTGQQFGRLTLLRFSHRRKRTTYWFVRCNCGAEKTVSIRSLQSGNTRSCGCLAREMSRSRCLRDGFAGKIKDRAGERYGRLTLLCFYAREHGKYTHWVAQCDCGNKTIVQVANLQTGATRSCGCLQRELTGKRRRTRGMTRTATYHSWAAMHARCKRSLEYVLNEITVCARWSDANIGFINFFEDMGERPDGCTLDRIDNALGYCRENCRWATPTQQNRNKRNTRWLEFRGERKCLAEWAEGINGTVRTLWMRLQRGWPLERALTEKCHNGKARIWP